MRPCPVKLIALCVLLLLALSSPGNAAIMVFDQDVVGDMTQTGNAVGLSKEFNANGPGNQDSIGTFMTTTPGLQDLIPANGANPWFVGTTNTWQLQSSAAVLDLPPGATVTRAQLVWGGSWRYLEDVSAFLDDAVSLGFEAETPVDAAPDPAFSVTLAEFSSLGFEANFYVRSAEVTSYVATHGAGQYEVGGIPATQNELINTLNAGGWTLYVVYELPSGPMRNVQLQIAGEYIEELNIADLQFEGFTTFDNEDLHAQLFLSALEGDANRIGDQLLILDPSNTLVPLSSSTRPADNYFVSLITDDVGALDTRGSFGDRNSTAGTTTIGARQGWDTTGQSLSSVAGQLVPGQSKLEVRAASFGDDYVLCAVGLSMDIAYAIVDAPTPLRERPALHDAVPNPFNPSTTISWVIPRETQGELVVYDLAGRRVRTLLSGTLYPGTNSVTWNGTDQAGELVASGVYLYQLSAGDFVETKRMVLLK